MTRSGGALSAAACLLAIVGLVGCSGSSASGDAHKDAGKDGAAGYGGSSSGGLGLQGGSSSGDDASGQASDDGSTGAPDATASDDGSQPSTEGGSVEGSAPDGGAGPSPSSSCVTPEGGLPCDPGHVACGSASCDTASQFCCMGGGSGASANVCSPFNGASCPATATAVACDETGDCSNSICCEEDIGLGVQGPTQCMSSCPSGWYQICKSDRECGGGDGGGPLNRCIRQTCTQVPGLLGGGASITIEACAVPATLGNLDNRGALAGCVAQ